MDNRLVYRVVLKLLSLLALGILTIVFINSLFISRVPENSKQNIHTVVELDLSGMLKGEIRKIRWESKEVAVLRREDATYFTFTNMGDSGNCPLFKESNSLKDVCTGTRFDFSGRDKNKLAQGVKLSIPPHYFLKDRIFIGSWK